MDGLHIESLLIGKVGGHNGEVAWHSSCGMLIMDEKKSRGFESSSCSQLL